MGTYHELYVEAFLDKWVCINGFVLDMMGKYVPAPILEGGSILFGFVRELNEMPIEYDDLADGTKQFIKERFKTGADSGPNFDRGRFASFNYSQDIKTRLKRKHEYEYYVWRRTIASFENGGIDEIEHFLLREKYEKLSSEERKEYAFYQWNEPYSAFDSCSRIVQAVELAISNYNATGVSYEYKLLSGRTTISESDVRLILWRT